MSIVVVVCLWGKLRCGWLLMCVYEGSCGEYGCCCVFVREVAVSMFLVVFL